MFYVELNKAEAVTRRAADGSVTATKRVPTTHLVTSFHPDEETENMTVLHLSKGFNCVSGGYKGDEEITSVIVGVPYEAVKHFAAAAMAKGQIVDFKDENWDNLAIEYQSAHWRPSPRRN